MSFKKYKSNKALNEAFKNLTENYAIISTKVPEKLLEEFSLYRTNIELCTNKFETELKEVFIVLDVTQEVIQKIVEGWDDKFVIHKNNKSHLISSNDNINSYPGFGKSGVEVLVPDLFNESGEQQAVLPKTEDGVLFPTEFNFS